MLPRRESDQWEGSFFEATVARVGAGRPTSCKSITQIKFVVETVDGKPHLVVADPVKAAWRYQMVARVNQPSLPPLEPLRGDPAQLGLPF